MKLNMNIIQNYTKLYKMLQSDLYYCHCDDASNNVLMLDNKIIVRVLNIVMTQTNDIHIIGRKCNIINSLYERPCLSGILSIFIVVEDNKLYNWDIIYIYKQVICKMWVIPSTTTEFIVIPLRHNKN